MILSDKLEMQKIWQDNELIELRVVGSSSVITATSKIYVSNDLINDLCNQLRQFLNGQIEEGFWANEEKGDASTACVSLRFLHKDKLGHIWIEVFMELDDEGGYSRHNCCFYLNTELGLLTTFFESLPQLKYGLLGTSVILNGI